MHNITASDHVVPRRYLGASCYKLSLSCHSYRVLVFSTLPREILCQITGTSLQENFLIDFEHLDHIIETLEVGDEDIIKKKLTVAVFS